MKKQSTQILSIEGKDILLSQNNYIINSFKKFKATLDYSLETIKLEEVANKVLTKRDKKIFYIDNGKQRTSAIVNVTFNYAVKEYQLQKLGKDKIYVKHNSPCDLKNIQFINGLYILNGEINAIKIDITVDFNKEIRLPNGFNYIRDASSIDKIKHMIEVDETKIKIITPVNEIREKLYENGFYLNGKAMVRYKRSSGSSRVGKCLFIRKDLYKKMMEWSYMGLCTDGEIDLAAMESYISLSTSSIIDTIEIDPKSILLIDDYYSNFTTKAMVTRAIKTGNIINGIEEEILSTKEDEKVKIRNNIWDGMSLLESSVFKELRHKNNKKYIITQNHNYKVKSKINIKKIINKFNYSYKDKGFLLVRNQFLKSACFQCNIQKFFKDNEITNISQLNGKTLAKKIEDIKMITTPSSIKYLKFNNDYFQYINKIDSTFGIVKYEKPTKFFDGDMVQAHYQLLNTIQLNSNEVEVFLKPSLDYINLLKNDINVFREHLHINVGDKSDMDIAANSNDLMIEMLKLNSLFEKTDLFCNFRSEVIDSYIKNLRKGHILVPGTNAVLCGNGVEMLQSTIGKFKGEPVLEIDEVCCSNFKNGEELLGCRSPHVTMGNLWLIINVENNLISKYFTMSKQIVHINSIKNNVLEKLSSCDFDSDQIAITNSKLLIDSVKKNYNRFLVPTSAVVAKKVLRLNTSAEKADLDIKTSKNLIGEIVNLSQILNSKLWTMVNNNSPEDKIQKLYKDICTLDILSTIEIDKAKKEFSVNSDAEIKKLRKQYCSPVITNKNKLVSENIFLVLQKIHTEAAEAFHKGVQDLRKMEKPMANEEIRRLKKDMCNNLDKMFELQDKVKDYVQKTVRPKFFKIVGAGKNYYFEKHNTTMDYLQNTITSSMKNIRSPRRQGANAIVTLVSIFNKNIKIANADRKQANKIIIECIEANKEYKSIWRNENLSSKDKYLHATFIKNDFIDRLKTLNISSATIKKIIYNLDRDYSKKTKNELTSIGRFLLSCLFSSNKARFLEIFSENKEKIQILKRKNETYADWLKVIKLYDIDYVVLNSTL